ncbi:hypothetical protein H0E87_000839 [Populus deltoides]|uniref:Uncharacterized protein n=1 Tax=Populus deltoides TaxID=3696 RepID=A0A8T2ZQY3_POPDE|nr:hypothetical protein H0E87_000839 [Populus deltoides]
MGNLLNKEPPPPMVLVPPLFDFPPLAARTRMLESSYNILFGKLALRCLFEDYFEEASHFTTRIMLKPIDDPHVDFIATLSGPLNHKPEENIVGNASFTGKVIWMTLIHSWTFLFQVLTPFCKCALLLTTLNMDLEHSAFFHYLCEKGHDCCRISTEDYGVVGLRYGSENLSVGAALMPLASKYESPKHAWLVSKMGRLTVGVQYEPQYGSKDGAKYKNLMNWSAAVGYGVGSGSPLSPSFNFSLELAKASQGKVGPLSSTLAFAFKSWWKPSFTFNISATRDRIIGKTSYGFGIRIENLREASYQRADPNFVMLTPSKEHLAEGMIWKIGKRPMLQSDVNAGNFDGLPRELRPLGKIL